MGVDARSGKTQRISDLSNRIRPLGQDIQNFLFGPIRQEFVLGDLSPWIAVAARPRRDAFTGKPESFETSGYTHNFSILGYVNLLERGATNGVCQKKL